MKGDVLRNILIIVMLMMVIGNVFAYPECGTSNITQTIQPSFTDDIIHVTIPTYPYTINHRDHGHEVTVEDFGYLRIPGKPKLPSSSFPAGHPIILPKK